MCKDLALKHKFNVCMIGRNEQKMKEKLNEIKTTCNSKNIEIKTMSVVCDFSKLTKIKEYEDLALKLNQLDIAMIFLNAGSGEPSLFLE